MRLREGRPSYDVPDIGFLYTVRITHAGVTYPLCILSSAELLLRAKNPNTAGIPAYAAVVRGSMHVHPTPDADYLAYVSYAPRPKTL